MTREKNGTIYKAVIVVLLSIATIITGSWAVEDRIDKKINAVRMEYATDSKCIREMEKTLVRIEIQLDNIKSQLDD